MHRLKVSISECLLRHFAKLVSFICKSRTLRMHQSRSVNNLEGWIKKQNACENISNSLAKRTQRPVCFRDQKYVLILPALSYNLHVKSSSTLKNSIKLIFYWDRITFFCLYSFSKKKINIEKERVQNNLNRKEYLRDLRIQIS